MERSYNLSAWYLNLRRLEEVIASDQFANTIRGITAVNSRALGPHVFAPSLGAVTRQLADWLCVQEIRPLQRLILDGSVAPGSLFTLYHHVRVGGLPAWRRFVDNPTRKRPTTVPLMYTTIDAVDPPIRVDLPFHHEHLVSDSAWTELSGQKRLFVFGYVKEVTATRIEARPYAIADIIDKTKMWNPAQNYFEVHVDQIGSFSNVRDVPAPSLQDLELLQPISEKRVKEAFAEIIGEPVIPKDWGGETSDLFSSHVQFEGERISAAFAFKGPSKFSEMTVAHLGKNGDQIERLFSEPVDLVVLQHCHQVHKSIRSIMRAFATQFSGIRRFCIIDGFDTLRVLRAYRKCGIG